jgi:hypothetical protein
MDRSTVPTLSSVQQLNEQLVRLKTRYEHVSQDLRDRTASNSILELKQLEHDFLMVDMEKLEQRIAQMKPRKTMQSIIADWLENLSFRSDVRALRRRYHVQNKPIHLL